MTQNIESSEKKRERDRAYARIYRNKNKEAIRERDRIRNENRKDYKRENRKAYYRDNKDKILQKSRDRYLTKREDILEQKRIYRKNNPELIQKSNDRWAKKNEHKVKIYRRKSHLKRSGFTLDLFRKVFDIQNGLCFLCGCEMTLEKYKKNSAHADHCHNTGNPRAILCLTCNTAEGMVPNDVISWAKKVLRLRSGDNPVNSVKNS